LFPFFFHPRAPSLEALLQSPRGAPLALQFTFFTLACAKKKPNREEESAWVTLRDWMGDEALGVIHFAILQRT